MPVAGHPVARNVKRYLFKVVVFVVVAAGVVVVVVVVG